MDDLDRGMKLEDGTCNEQQEDSRSGVMLNLWTAMGDCYVGVNLQPAFGRQDASELPSSNSFFLLKKKKSGLDVTVGDKKQEQYSVNLRIKWPDHGGGTKNEV